MATEHSNSEAIAQARKLEHYTQSSSSSFSFAFTVYLYVLGGFALLGVASMQMYLAVVSGKPDVNLSPEYIRGIQAIQAIIFLFAVTAAVLRSKKSELARGVTAAVSILLIIWIPFGTAAFVWWVGWVRRREHSK